MTLQEQHHLFDLALLLPGAAYHIDTLRANPLDLIQTIGVVVQHIKRFQPKVVDDSFRDPRPDAAYHPRSEVAAYSFDGGRRNAVDVLRAELLAMLGVSLPL